MRLKHGIAVSILFVAAALSFLFLSSNPSPVHSQGRKVLNISLNATRDGFVPDRIVVDSRRYWAVNITATAVDVTHSFRIDGIAYAYLPVGVPKTVFINVSSMKGNYTYYSDVYAGPGVRLEGLLEVK